MIALLYEESYHRAEYMDDEHSDMWGSHYDMDFQKS